MPLTLHLAVLLAAALAWHHIAVRRGMRGRTLWVAGAGFVLVQWLVALGLYALVAAGDAAAAERETVEGRVVAIADGDTLTLLTVDKVQVPIRLAEIDAPEKGQAFGQVAKRALSDLCFGKPAIARVQTVDRYGRRVARIECDGVDATEAMLRTGHAWVYDRYVTDRGLYAVQESARSAKEGLWSDPNAIAPWDWRRASRARADRSDCGSRGGPGWRKPNGQCASWEDEP
jgi:endonuclease YncB( thermonuclease family)